MARALAEVAPEQVDAALACFEGDLAEAATRRENKPRGWGFAVSVMAEIARAINGGRVKQAKEMPAAPQEESRPLSSQERRQMEQRLRSAETPEYEKRALEAVLAGATA